MMHFDGETGTPLCAIEAVVIPGGNMILGRWFEPDTDIPVNEVRLLSL